jgi:hypothetical protein
MAAAPMRASIRQPSASSRDSSVIEPSGISAGTSLVRGIAAASATG